MCDECPPMCTECDLSDEPWHTYSVERGNCVEAIPDGYTIREDPEYGELLVPIRPDHRPR